jgi:hypothetical protein
MTDINLQEQNINSMLGLISKDKEVVLSKAQKLLALDSQETMAEIETLYFFYFNI